MITIFILTTFKMVTISAYVALLIGALGLTLTIYLGLLKVVKLI
jgi:Cytochrome B6-F complex subunit VI (PetL)